MCKKAGSRVLVQTGVAQWACKGPRERSVMGVIGLHTSVQACKALRHRV